MAAHPRIDSAYGYLTVTSMGSPWFHVPLCEDTEMFRFACCDQPTQWSGAETSTIR